MGGTSLRLTMRPSCKGTWPTWHTVVVIRVLLQLSKRSARKLPRQMLYVYTTKKVLVTKSAAQMHGPSRQPLWLHHAHRNHTLSFATLQ